MEPPRKIDLYSIFADASPEILELLRESEERLNARPPKSNLLPGEEFWRDHQVWLQEQGYMLRPRYHPDWEPSWKRKNIEFYEAEDYIQFPVSFVLPWIVDDDAEGMLR